MMKQPWKAVFLTGLYTGAGHVYAGAKTTGYFLICLSTILGLSALGLFIRFITSQEQDATKFFMAAALAVFALLLAIQLFAFFDSHKAARTINSDHNLDPHATMQKKPWLSVFLSFIYPGIGQFYNGQVLKGFAFLIAALVLSSRKNHQYYAVAFLSLALEFIAIKDAFDSAEKRNSSPERFLYQGNWLLVFVIVTMFFSAAPFNIIIRDHLVEAFKIPASSMIPTLQIGDHILVDKRRTTVDNLRPGDIIVFPHPEDCSKNFIKRIVAMAGDKVQFKDGDLYINDALVQKQLLGTRPVGKELSGLYPEARTYKERLGDRTYTVQYLHNDLDSYTSQIFTVPENSLFVLGDNRDNSQDSRIWGSVPRDTVKGKALKIYWSWDRKEAKVNWERIGQMIL
jgi:signal peptidase I